MSADGDLRLRRAEPADLDFLVELVNHEGVRPFLSGRRSSGPSEIRERIARSQREPEAFGLFVIEVGGERAGTCQFERSNEPCRIASLGGLAVHPEFRGRRIADEAARRFQRLLLLELGFHRLELEVYGFNDRAIRHAERSGFVREGVKRKAYWRHGDWVDSVLFGLVREDLAEEEPPTA